MFLRKVQVRFQFNVSITEIEFTIYLTIGSLYNRRYFQFCQRYSTINIVAKLLRELLV